MGREANGGGPIAAEGRNTPLVLELSYTVVLCYNCSSQSER